MIISAEIGNSVKERMIQSFSGCCRVEPGFLDVGVGFAETRVRWWLQGGVRMLRKHCK